MFANGVISRIGHDIFQLQIQLLEWKNIQCQSGGQGAQKLDGPEESQMNGHPIPSKLTNV